MELVFRSAVLADAEVLARMRLEMRRERETVPCPVDESEFFRYNLEFFRRHIGDGSFISCIVMDGAEAAACSGLSLEVHPPTYENLTGRIGYITNIYTRPAWRGRGIAGQMVQWLAEAAREAGCARLCLNSSPMGRSVYLRCGFTPVEGEMMLDLAPKL